MPTGVRRGPVSKGVAGVTIRVLPRVSGRPPAVTSHRRGTASSITGLSGPPRSRELGRVRDAPPRMSSLWTVDQAEDGTRRVRGLPALPRPRWGRDPTLRVGRARAPYRPADRDCHPRPTQSFRDLAKDSAETSGPAPSPAAVRGSAVSSLEARASQPGLRSSRAGRRPRTRALVAVA